jgi:two-component system sensor histidine kinase BarA
MSRFTLKMDFKHRVIALTLGPIAAISLSWGAYCTYVQMTDLEDKLVVWGESMVLRLAHTGALGITTRNAEFLNNLSQLALQEHEVSSVAFYSPTGELLGHGGTMTFPRTLPNFTELKTRIFTI